MVKANALLLGLSLLLGVISCSYRHKIEPFSFDTKRFEYPLEFAKFGTTVALRDLIKLLPKIESRFGALFMSQPVETDSFEMIYKVEVKNDKNTMRSSHDPAPVDDIEGFVIWYLNHEPEEANMRTTFGYREDFNGVGLFVFKHEGKWRAQSIINEGLSGLTVQTAVHNLSKYLRVSNLCSDA